MKYFPNPSLNVPPVELVALPTGWVSGSGGAGQRRDDGDGNRDGTPLFQKRAHTRGGSAATSPVSTDIRLPIVHEFLRSVNLEANSRRAYERALRRFLSWSNTPFAEVSPPIVARYREWLETTPTHKTGKPFSRNSANLEIATLKRFFGWLNLNYPHHCPTNPTVQVKQRKVNLTTPDDIAPAALDWIWTTLPTLGQMKLRDTALVHLLCHGLRASEAVGLNIASFDGENLFLAQTKTHTSRIVPLSRSSMTVLEQYFDWRRRELEAVLSPESPLLISLNPAYQGKRLSYSGIYQAVERIGVMARRACVINWVEQQEQGQEQDEIASPPPWWDSAKLLKLGFEQSNWDEAAEAELLPQLPDLIRRILDELADLHPHNFRHTYATQLLLKGLDPSHARKLTGHQSQQVFRRYTLRAEQQAAIDAFRRLEQEFGGTVVPKQP